MISDTFIQRPKFAFVISILITLGGLITLATLPVNLYPELTPPQIQISAVYPGANAAAVEEAVTRPIEKEVNGVEGMLYVESTSANNGSATITVTFETGTDVDIAQVNVQNRVALAEPFLPTEVNRQGVAVSKRSSNMLLGINLFSERPELDDIFLNNYANNNLLESIARIPGVAQAQILGGKEFSMRVWLRPDRMTALGVTVAEVTAALQEQNQIIAAGKLGEAPVPEGQQFVYSIQGKGQLSDVGQFEQIIVRARQDGSFIRLSDIARVELGARSYSSNAKLNNGDTAFLVVYQLPDANALDVADQVRSEVARLAESFPDGLQYEMLYDTTKFIERSISEVVVTLFQAVALVILVVFLFLQNWRATLIPAIAIPVSLIGTFIFMAIMGFSLNTITLFGLVLAIGIVVDDAIVVIENVERILKEEDLPVKEAVSKAMSQVGGPIVATTLVLMAVFVPVAFMPGITGELYKQFAVTIAFAVAISSVNALSLSPALCSILLSRENLKPISWLQPVNRLIEKLTGGYDSMVGGLLRRGVRVGIFVLVLFGAAGWLATAVPTSFVPAEDQGFLFINVQLPDAASLERTDKVLATITDIVRQDPAVEDVITVSGFSIMSGSDTNAGLGIAVLKDWEERTTPELSLRQVIPRLSGQLWALPEAQILVFNVPPIPGLGTSAGFDYRLIDTASREPLDLAQLMNGLIFRANQEPDLNRVFSTYRASTPQYLLEVDRNKAKALGVELSELFQTIQAQLGSFYVNDFSRYGKNYRVILQAEGAYRDAPEDLSQYYVRNRDSEMVPVSTLARLTPILGPTQIQHFNLQRSVTITGEPSAGHSSGEAVAKMAALSESLPQGYTYDWAGQTRQEIAAGSLAPILFGLAVIFVYLFLVAQYESWTLPMAAIGAVPLALFGAMAGLYVAGMANDIYAQVGLVLLIGLSTKTAILIVEFAMQLRAEGHSPMEAAKQAAVLRFRAVLMTALSFVLGVLPLVFASGAGAASRISLGFTVLLGMLAATVFGTLLVPVFYQWIQTLREKLKGTPGTEQAASH